MFTNHDQITRSNAPVADPARHSPAMEAPVGQCSGRTVQQAEPTNHLDQALETDVVQTPEHRVARRSVSDVHKQSLQLLSRLAERQLLLPRERAALESAVLNNEVVIDPQQCRFAKSIDALRLFAAFLGIMEKSPTLKRALGVMINDTPVSQSPLEDTVAEGMFGGSPEAMNQALEDLKSILAKFVQLHPDCSQDVPIAHDVREDILGKLDQCWKKYNLTIGNQAFYPFSKPDANCSVVKYWEHLTAMIDLLEQIPGYTDLHERIDKLDVNKVLTPTAEFMALLHVLSFLRVPEVSSLDAMEIDRLFSVDEVFGHAYYQAKIFRSSCEWVEERTFPPMKLADGGFLLNTLWVNYLNGCHIELKFLPFHDHVKALAPPWVDNTLARQVASFIHHQERFDNVSNMLVVYYPARMITNSVLALRPDTLRLYGGFVKIHQPDNEFAPGVFAFADRVVQGCLAREATMDDIEWMLSLVMRGGLEYDRLNSQAGSRKLQCPGCSFYGLVDEREDPVDYYDADYMECGDSLRLSYHHFASSAVRDMQHVHRDVMRVLWFHKKHSHDCTIARAVDVQKLWNERYSGSCLAPVADDAGAASA